MQESRLLDLFCELVRIESPSFHEAPMAARCADELRGLGFEVSFDDSAERVGSDTGNLVARLPGTRTGHVVFSAHMDTVQPCAGIEPVVVDGVVRSAGDTILSVQHLSTKYAPYLQDVSFDVKEGEIFGLYGLVGAGRTELLETIFGVRTRAAGRVYFKNRLMNFNSAREAIDHGFAMITEERKANGLFLKCDLTFNTTIANLEQYKTGLALSNPKMVKATNKEIKIMRTKCMGPDDMISSLSGGNQQKVIFGKWLEREPQVFMMDEPTRGIDVGAKYEIYELIINMAKQGKTIIVVSSEMPEILGITNRIGVMSNGHLSGIVNTKETDQEELLRLSAKYL